MRFLLALALLLPLAGCEREMHNMYRQPRFDPGDSSPLFADGRTDRPPPAGSVPMAAGTLAMTSSGRKGHELPAQWQAADAATSPPPITQQVLARGQETGQIRADVPLRLLRSMVFGPMEHVLWDATLANRRTDIEATADSLIDVLWAALQPPNAPLVALEQFRHEVAEAGRRLEEAAAAGASRPQTGATPT